MMSLSDIPRMNGMWALAKICSCQLYHFYAIKNGLSRRRQQVKTPAAF
jgi:hypothetical protein